MSAFYGGFQYVKRLKYRYLKFKRRLTMAKNGTNSNSGRNYAGQNTHRGPALPPNNHDGGNWPSTHSGKTSGSGRGNAAPKNGSHKGK